MKRSNMRKEMRIGIILMAVYNCLYFFGGEVGQGIAWYEFLTGLIVGVSIGMMILGLLPETTYQKIKGLKKKILY